MFVKRFKIMGNSMYRISPSRIFNYTLGSTSHFQFAANQITGWRNSQEDRYVCLPNFHEDLSLFAVYDGHGGEEVVQYLERFLHLFISRELELTKDVELALYLAFLNCDSSIRSISDAEFALIENDLEKEFEVPDKAERRRVLFGAIDVAGTSGENQVRDELRAAIASTCIRELIPALESPTISYLTQAPVQESDDSDDDDYKPEDEDINYLTGDMDSSDQSRDSQESYSSESFEEESMDVFDKEEKLEKRISSTIKEDAGSTVKDVTGKKKEQECDEEQKDFGRQIGMDCGSTATVLLINPTKIFIAHVGDSRCVACIKGQAVDLTTDHRPTDKEEYERIINAGGSVSEDGRIQGDIDMSRAFGDFRHKAMDDPFQMLSVEPSISSLEISPDLEFIIIASDGIWNTMDSADVVHYIQKRISDPSLKLQDLCGELFEEMLPEKITADGSGCDNMTAIIIKFTSTQGLSSKNAVCYREIYEYRYPPINNKSSNSSTNNETKNSSTDENSQQFNSGCKESSQLKLDEKKEKIHSSESSDKSKEYCESEFDKKKAGYEIEDEKEFCSISSEGRYSSENTKEYVIYEERILTHQKQQLCRSNKYCNPATMKAAQTQQKINPSKSCKDNSPQLLRKCSSNFSKNCRSNSSIPLHHTNNMDKLLKSLKGVESAIHGLNQNVSSIKTEVRKEIKRINKQYPTNSSGTTTRSPMQMKEGLVEPTKGNILTTEQSVERDQIVSQVDSASMQSHSMQMETDLVSLTNEGRQNPEQSVEKDEDSDCMVIQSNTKQIEVVEIIDCDESDESENDIAEVSFFVKQPVAKDKINLQSVDSEVHIKSHAMKKEPDCGVSTNEEVKLPASQRVDSAIVQSHTMQIEMDAVNPSNKEIKTPEQGKVVDSVVMQSPSMHRRNAMHVRNLIINEDKQTTVQSVDKKEEETIRDSCKKNQPAKERNQFGR